MKTLITFLFLLSICSFFTPVFSQDENFTVKLSVEKDAYEIEELIVVKLKYFNNDTIAHVITCNCSLEDDILNSVVLIDTNGFRFRHDDGMIIDCIGGRIEVTTGGYYETYGIHIFDNMTNGFQNYSFLPAGKYSIFSSYYGNSDTVNFLIKNDENSSHLRMNRIKLIEDKYEKFDKWREYMVNKRNAIYSFYAMGSLLNSFRLYEGKMDMMEKDFINFFRIDPNAWGTDVFLFQSAFLVNRNKDENEMLKFLQTVISTCPVSRASILAEKIIREKKIPDRVY